MEMRDMMLAQGKMTKIQQNDGRIPSRYAKMITESKKSHENRCFGGESFPGMNKGIAGKHEGMGVLPK